MSSKAEPGREAPATDLFSRVVASDNPGIVIDQIDIGLEKRHSVEKDSGGLRNPGELLRALLSDEINADNIDTVLNNSGLERKQELRLRGVRVHGVGVTRSGMGFHVNPKLTDDELTILFDLLDRIASRVRMEVEEGLH
jgi:hypothetical protein